MGDLLGSLAGERDAELLRLLEAQRIGENVLHRYQRLVDAKDVDGLGALVTDDVLLRRQDGDRHGRDEFLAFYQRFADSDVQTAQHSASNVQVMNAGKGVMRVDSCFLAITTHASGEARLMWGRYSDDVVLREGRWLIAAKRIALIRTAFIEASALASPSMDSFGPRGSGQD